MENSSIINAVGFLSSKERAALYKVLNNYNFNIYDISKYGNIYKIETSSGPVCLKKSEYRRKEIRNSYLLSSELSRNGFNNIEKYIPTRQGEIYIKEDKKLYYSTEWLEGQRCSLSNIKDAIKCIGLLSRLHKASNEVNTKELNLKLKNKNLLKAYSNYLSDLSKYKRIIQTKRIRNEFDARYYSYIDFYTSLGMLSLNLLNKCNYTKLVQNSENKKTIGFSKLTERNILKTNKGCYIIDLNELCYNLQIYDLAWFIKKYLSKKPGNWKFEDVLMLIEEYSALNTLSVDYLGVLLAIVLFPDRFCKLGKKRYIKSKNWSEQKYLDKLHRIIGNIKDKEIFIDKSLKYLDGLQKSI